MNESRDKRAPPANDTAAELVRLRTELDEERTRLRHVLGQVRAISYRAPLRRGPLAVRVDGGDIIGLLGYCADECSESGWWLAHIHPEDRGRAIASVRETIDEGAGRAEYRLFRKDGRCLWIDDRRRLVRGADGAAEIAGVWRDVSERKELEAELAVRQRRLDSFFEYSNAGMAILDADLRYVRVNPALSEINGLSVEAHLGRTVREVLPGLAPKLEPLLQAALATAEGATGFELSGTTRREPGAVRHWIGSHFPIRDASGKPAWIGVVVVEISDRKRVEEALRTSEAKFRQLAECVQEVFWIGTLDATRVIYANPAFERIWGVPVEELYRRPRAWIDAVLPEDRERVEASFASLIRGAPSVECDYRIRRPDGSVRWIVDRGFPVLDESGRTYRIGGIAVDVTDRKAMEEGLRRAQRLEAVGQLASGIAHDFNNILGCILGHAELMLARGDSSGDAAESLDAILRAGHRAAELVQRVLTFCREDGEERRPVALAPLVGEVLFLLRASLPATVEIRSEIADASIVVRASASQIHRLLMNLATNAAQAMPDGGRLSVALERLEPDAAFLARHPELEPGRYVRLTVADDGCGMDASVQQHLFEPFFTTKPPGVGTGLGLAVVHGIVRGHRGAIEVDSAPGKGSRFDVCLPALEAAVAADDEARELSPANGARVLLVDDEAPLVEVQRAALEGAGFVVTAHTDPEAALSAFRAAPADFDAVVTDWRMPQLTGLDLARALRSLRPDVPVVLTTGFAGGLPRASVESSGICTVLAKPATAERLIRAVHLALCPSA